MRHVGDFRQRNRAVTDRRGATETRESGRRCCKFLVCRIVSSDGYSDEPALVTPLTRAGRNMDEAPTASQKRQAAAIARPPFFRYRDAVDHRNARLAEVRSSEVPVEKLVDRQQRRDTLLPSVCALPVSTTFNLPASCTSHIANDSSGSAKGIDHRYATVGRIRSFGAHIATWSGP